MLRFVLPVLLLAASVARADNGAPPPGDEKSPGLAVVLSLGTTTLGVALTANANDEHTAMLGLATMLVGPSTGRWYAGESGLGTLALRGAGGLMFVYGFATVLESECDEDPCSDEGDKGGMLMLAGAGIWLGTSIADIIFAKQDADHWNERRRALTLAPTLMQGPPGGASATGLVLRGSW